MLEIVSLLSRRGWGLRAIEGEVRTEGERLQSQARSCGNGRQLWVSLCEEDGL